MAHNLSIGIRELEALDLSKLHKQLAMKQLSVMIEALGYSIVEIDATKPWGGYIRMKNANAKKFLKDFFPHLSLTEVGIGNNMPELSPKVLFVLPGQQLSWQYHTRRAEWWRFLSDGAYIRNLSDKQGKQTYAKSGTIVQFSREERHRLCTVDADTFCLVAEIWQHTEPGKPSDEADIVRLEDDYQRSEST